MQFFNVEGFGKDTLVSSISPNLYHGSGNNIRDYQYAFLRVNEPVYSVEEIKRKYLEGVEKLFFKLMVKMPGDNGSYGLGTEFVPACTANLRT